MEQFDSSVEEIPKSRSSKFAQYSFYVKLQTDRHMNKLANVGHYIISLSEVIICYVFKQINLID